MILASFAKEAMGIMNSHIERGRRAEIPAECLLPTVAKGRAAAVPIYRAAPPLPLDSYTPYFL